MTITDRIEISPKVMLGKPVIRGTRIPVELILRKLAGGLARPTCSTPILASRVTTSGRLLAIGERGRSRGSRDCCREAPIVKFTRITLNPEHMAGVPCVRGLRIPVATVVEMVADGMTDAEILEAYPDLGAEDVHEALRYAAEAVRERTLPPGAP